MESRLETEYFMMDKSSLELNAVGNVFPLCVQLLCDFHRAQAWQRWVNKSANDVVYDDKELVFTYLKQVDVLPSKNQALCYLNYCK